MHNILETSQQFYDIVPYYQPHFINEEIETPNALKNLHVKVTSIKLPELISLVIHFCILGPVQSKEFNYLNIFLHS